MYLPEVQGVTRGPTDKDPASYDQYGRHPRHETENLAMYGETENRLSYRHGPKSRRTRRGKYPEKEEKYSEGEPHGDRKDVQQDYRPCWSRLEPVVEEVSFPPTEARLIRPATKVGAIRAAGETVATDVGGPALRDTVQTPSRTTGGADRVEVVGLPTGQPPPRGSI